MRPQQLLAAALTLSSLSAAWPWPPNVDDMKAVMGIEGLFRRDNFFYARQDDQSSTDSSSESTAKATKTDSASASDKTTASDTASKTGTAATTGSGTKTDTASETGKTTGTAKGTGTKTSKGSSKSTYDARLPAGGISMITPAATDSSQYYKIGDWLSFAWNYTSLSQTPSAVNILATCTKNQEMYTIAMNQSVHQTQMVYWDTGEYQSTATKRLIMETYTLIVYDADTSVSATAAAGYLGVSKTFTFGMYLPQEYTPRTQWVCPSCSNAGNANMEKQTIRFLMGTFAITVASFTWFVVGLGIV